MKESEVNRIKNIIEEVKQEKPLMWNIDFISDETYEALIERLDVRGKKIADIGAGLLPFMNQHASPRYLNSLPGKGALFVPFDKKPLRAKSWKVLQGTDMSEENETIVAPVIGDVIVAPFRNESLDGVICGNLLNSGVLRSKGQDEIDFYETVDRTILGEIYRVLKHGGFAILSSFGYVKYVFNNGTEEFNDALQLSDIVTKQKVIEMAKSIGFDVEDIPLDQAKINEANKLSYERNKKLGVIKATTIEAFGFLLRKI